MVPLSAALIATRRIASALKGVDRLPSVLVAAGVGCFVSGTLLQFLAT